MNSDIKRKGKEILKSETGIEGLDQIMKGGIPAGRPTLLVGESGTGKTILAMESLINGANKFNENGVVFSFEESKNDLIRNVEDFHWDLEKLIEENRIIVDEILLDSDQLAQSGDYNLEGLFIRMESRINKIKARRIVIDTLEGLFQYIPDERKLRSELRRLFRWIKSRGLTAIITAEAGRDQLTRYGLEEYVSDCVILLQNKVFDHMTSRRLRILKFRGSDHGENEYPFLISSQGIFISPITSLSLDFKVSNKRLKTGIERLDSMLGGKGFFKGSSILITGTVGTGKTTFANTFLHAACKRGEKGFYFSFEESYHQIIRNMKSVGMDLMPFIKRGLLKYHSTRPTTHTLEKHLIDVFRSLEEFNPDIVVFDPVSNLRFISDEQGVKNMLTRLADYTKSRGITSIFTELITASEDVTTTTSKVSSLMDTWILLTDLEIQGERNKTLYILKSRGMHHSNQIREFNFTSKGIQLTDVYIGPEGVLTGTARSIQETRQDLEQKSRLQEIDSLKKELKRKDKEFKAQIEQIRTNYISTKEQLELRIKNAELKEKMMKENRKILASKRGKDY